jgi:hypothetical protein
VQDRIRPAAGIFLHMIPPSTANGLYEIRFGINKKPSQLPRRLYSSPWGVHVVYGKRHVVPLTSKRQLVMSLALKVDKVLGPAAFLHDLRAIFVEVCYNDCLLYPPALSAPHVKFLDHALDSTAFPLEGLTMPDICLACDYDNDAMETFNVLSARLSWLCRTWFYGCSGFLEMLYNSGAMVSGSAALKVVSGKNFVPSDTDIVVSALGADAVEDFLLMKGYMHVKSWISIDDDYATSSLLGLCVRHFMCGHRSIDVSISPVSFLLFPVPHMLTNAV